MNFSNLKCSLGCQEDEDQNHIFENCSFLNTDKEDIRLGYIFENIVRQKEAIEKILIIETQRLKRHCKPSHQSQSQNCATFTSHIWSIL